MSKILVKASPQIQIGPDGKPQMYYNVGFSGRRGGGDGARGRTKRSRVLGAGGAALGALGGLAGGSRSLGGFLSNLQVGAMQGGAAGRGLANLATTRTRQARADMREQRRIDDTKQRAAELEERRAQGKGFNVPVPRRDDDGKLRLRNFDLARLNPMARVRAHNYGVQQSERQALDRANFSQQTQMAANEQLGRELARQGKDEYKQRTKGRQRDAEPVLQAVENINQERIQPALDLLTGLGIQAPQQQPQAPQQIAPLSQETQNQITQGDTQPPVDAPFADHDMDQSSAGQIGEGEMPESEGDEQQEQRVPSRLQRRFETDEEEQRGFDTFMGGGQ